MGNACRTRSLHLPPNGRSLMTRPRRTSAAGLSDPLPDQQVVRIRQPPVEPPRPRVKAQLTHRALHRARREEREWSAPRDAEQAHGQRLLELVPPELPARTRRHLLHRQDPARGEQTCAAFEEGALRRLLEEIEHVDDDDRLPGPSRQLAGLDACELEVGPLAPRSLCGSSRLPYL